MKAEKKNHMGSMRFIPLLLMIVVLFQCPGVVFAQDSEDPEKKEKITYRITGNIYFGDKNRYSSPCVLDRDKVFNKIPAYQAIKREKLDKSSARYFMLIEEANRVFRAHVKDVAEKLGFDLVVERGGIKASKKGVKIPDITRDVIRSITG